MNKIIKFENIILAVGVILFTMVMSYEYNNRKDMYSKEKIYDLELQYKDKIMSNKVLVEALYGDVLENDIVSKLMFESSNNIDKDLNREKLLNIFKEKYKRMNKQGILQFHFHLTNGDSFLRFHKPKKYGDNLLSFRDSIKKVIETKQPVYGFEVGRYFEGFRYVYPLFYKNQYVGSVESSINASRLMKQMQDFLDAKYFMILKKDLVDSLISKEHIDKYYHKFKIDDKYYMANRTYKDKKTIQSSLKYIKKSILSSLNDGNSFIKISQDYRGNNNMLVFIKVPDIYNNNVGYIFSLKEDNTIQKIYNAQLIKWFLGIILILLVYYFYKQNRQKTKSIEQLKKAIDVTTLVSKTDLKGRITYVNKAFIELSGFTKKELLGANHNIVRHEDTTDDTFKTLWNTIKNKKIWHGQITNKKKNGAKYTVDATIIPILDVNDNIKEYIAIRHDITELEDYKNILKATLETTHTSLVERIKYTTQYEDAINKSTSILKTDTDNIITFANDEFCKLSGYSLKELVGLNCRDIRDKRHITENDCKKIQDTLAKKELLSILFTNIHKNGEKYFLNTVVYPILDINENVEEHLHVMHDISEIIHLNEEIEETQKEVIFQMGAIGESRSKETGNHVKRVAEYSYLLAILYGLDEKEAELLKQSSPMHDIGKVGIPDAVLKKPGKLDKDEWVIMMSHAQLGYEMLKQSTRPILKTAAIVAVEHHEKWDGSGYPNGLKEDEIHIYGRITAIADVFDALGSQRVYKKAWELEKILNLFKEEKGKHFDPILIDLFLTNLNKFLEIRDKFKDSI